jgi:hypothetical protein
MILLEENEPEETKNDCMRGSLEETSQEGVKDEKEKRCRVGMR